MPRERKQRLSVKGVAAALRQCRGNVSAVARMYGVDRSTAHRYVHARPELLAVAQECRETMLDAAETVMENTILAGDVGACQWYLTRLGKNRGYTERHEHTGADGQPIRITTIRAIAPGAEPDPPDA